jgi:vacuolar protein sorting-associated protein 13A/C
MFESILERILISRLGKYIAGLDKNHLSIGVWSGDIVLENAYLKPELVKMLGLPLFLKYGKVTRLHVKVPWTKLSSAPVEVELSGVYVLLHQENQDQWQYSDIVEVLKKKEAIERHEAAWEAKREQKQLTPEQQLKQSSFSDKLTARVIDNLRITIKDIHVRLELGFEDRNFTCGFCLQSITCITTDQHWQSSFQDRQKSGRAGEAIHKVVALNSLGFYWQSEDFEFISKYRDEDATLEAMQRLMYDSSLPYILDPSKR